MTTVTTPGTYSVFLSYSRADSDVADLLQHTLEGFHRGWFSREPRIRVLRDVTNLKVGPGLDRSIRDRLAESQWLVLVASTSARSSDEVAKELEAWRALDPGFERIVIVLARGTLVWNAEVGAWDEEASTALPAQLHVSERPNWKDLSGIATRSLSRRDQRTALDATAFDIVSNLRGVEKDVLQAEHDRRRRRQIVAQRAATVAALLLVAASLLLWYRARQDEAEADRQTGVATSRLLMQRGSTEVDSGRGVADALAAYTVTADADTRSALLDQVLRNRFIARLDGRPEDPRPETVARAGDLLLREGPSHTLAAVDLSRPEALGPPQSSPPAACSPGSPPTDGVPAGPCGTIDAIAVTPDGRTAASGGEDDQVVLWDLARGGPPRPVGPALPGSAPPSDLPGRIGAADPGPRLGDVLALAFSPDGRRLAVGGRDQTVSIWDVGDRSRPVLLTRQVLPGTGLEVLSLAYSPDGRTIAVGSRTNEPNNVLARVAVQLWDLSDPSRPVGVRELDLRPRDLVEPVPVSFTPDGHYVLSAWHGRPRAWDLLDPSRAPLDPPVNDGAHATAVTALAVAPDGQTVATGGFDTQVRLWRLRPDGRLTRIADPLVGQSAAVTGLVFSGDSQELATGGYDGDLLVWAAGDSPRAELLAESPLGQGGGQSLVTSPDGRFAVTGGRSKSVVLWDLGSGLPVRRAEAYAGRDGDRTLPQIRQRGVVAAFSPDGRRLVTGSVDGAMRFFDIGDDGGLVPRGPVLTGPVALSAVAFDARGDAVVVGDDVGTVTAVTGVGGDTPVVHAPVPIARSPVSDLARSPDGRALVVAVSSLGELTGSFAQLLVVDGDGALRTSGPPMTGHSSGLTGAVFTSDGRSVLTGSIDRSLRRWQLTPAGPELAGRPQYGHAEAVTGVAVAPDGLTAATSGADSTVRLWDLSDPTTLRPLGPPVTGSPAGLPAVGFTTGGRLVSLSLDDVLRTYDLTDLQALRRDPLPSACATTSGGMSPAQWTEAGLDVPFRPSCPPS